MNKEQIIQACMPAAERKGYANITRRDAARAVGRRSGSIVNYHFGGVEQLREAVLQAAIAEENLTIVAQAVLLGRGVPQRLHDLIFR